MKYGSQTGINGEGHNREGRRGGSRRGEGDWLTGSHSFSSRRKRPSEEEEYAADVDHIYGVMPVLAALRASRRAPMRVLYVQDGLDAVGSGNKKRGGESLAVRDVLDRARDAGVPLERLPKGDLNELTGKRPHQGLVLAAGPLSFSPLDALPVPGRGKSLLWLALDEVQDPQNLGAILRSAKFMGVSGVLVSSKNCAPLSPAVSKASAGAMESMVVYSTSNLPGILERATSTGWRVVGTALDRRAIGLNDLKVCQQDSLIVVMGNEGAGLRTNVKSVCTELVEIEGGGGDPGLDSLNVSVAAAVIIHEVKRRQNDSDNDDMTRI